MNEAEIIAAHFDRLKKLMELEEAEEIQQYQQDFLKLTPEERQTTGQALLRLKISEFHFSPAGHRLASFRYADSKPLPLYSPDAGDVVTLSHDPHELWDLPLGTVYEKNKDTITVAFNRELPEWVHEEGIYYLNMSGNRATYKKLTEALDRVSRSRHERLAFLRDLSLGLRKSESPEPLTIEKISFLNSGLNSWQKEAARMALAAPEMAIVHGPPGTGKTTVLVEIIRQQAAIGDLILATAPSNTACDHLLECLVKSGVQALRLGHPARIMKHLRQHTLDFKLAHHEYAKNVEEMEFELERLFVRENRQGRSREVRERIQELKHQIRELDRQIFSQVMAGAQVIVGTHTAAADPLIKSRIFDLVIMDEASQATEPSCWVPIIRGKKIILAGDHFQLPPTVLSKKAEEMGLSKTLFERLHKILPEEFKTLLRVQYRMHEKIMNFSSREFYDGKLIADKSVKKHTLADLEHVKRGPESEEVFLYLDTAGRGFEEKLEPGSESRYNCEEAELVLKHVKRLFELGLRPEEMAVISPYSAQVRLLASLMPHPDIEVDSVDGFQGREKEAVVLSLVRSNVEGEMGFLTDTRRMNVAMTRARRKLVVIGDSATLSNIAFYKDFIQYAESIGAYRSSWEEE